MIQFLRAWNGYEPFQVATLSAPQESALISDGLARDYYEGIDGSSPPLGGATAGVQNNLTPSTTLAPSATAVLGGLSAAQSAAILAAAADAQTKADARQEQLVSGTNVKTINGQSILGGGNLTIAGTGGATHHGAAANEAAMIALSSAVVGDMCTRSDTGTVWILGSAPYSSAANWLDTGLTAELATKVDFKARQLEMGTAWTLNSADHSGRRTDTGSVGAVTVTWNTGSGMTVGECGRIVQASSGAITIVAGTGTLNLAPGVAAATTSTIWSWLDWEYMGADILLVTAVGKAAAAGAQHVKLIAHLGAPVADIAPASTTDTQFFTCALPALGPNATVLAQVRLTGGTSTAAKNVYLKLNGTALHTYNYGTSPKFQSCQLGFNNINSVAVQEGAPFTMNFFGGGSSVDGGAATVNTAVPTTLVLSLAKTSGADVVNARSVTILVIDDGA